MRPDKPEPETPVLTAWALQQKREQLKKLLNEVGWADYINVAEEQARQASERAGDAGNTSAAIAWNDIADVLQVADYKIAQMLQYTDD